MRTAGSGPDRGTGRRPRRGACVALSDGTAASGHQVLVAIGRQVPWDGLGLEASGLSLAGGPPRPDERLRIAPDVYVVGDPAGPELHTHLAHYEGEMAVRIALGDDVIPDFRAIPRATYTDPETASVGLRLDEAEKRATTRSSAPPTSARLPRAT